MEREREREECVRDRIGEREGGGEKMCERVGERECQYNINHQKISFFVAYKYIKVI